ncbi:hypothetical protein N7490_011778 [Penicillium lividum]|nr:hypothetical protein N7490_011778 [Penicillium lividum]
MSRLAPLLSRQPSRLTPSSETIVSVSVGRSSSTIRSHTSAVYASSSSRPARSSCSAVHHSSSSSLSSNSCAAPSSRGKTSATISGSSNSIHTSGAHVPSPSESVSFVTLTAQTISAPAGSGSAIPQTDKLTQKPSPTPAQAHTGSPGSGQESSGLASVVTTTTESFASQTGNALSTTSTVLTTRTATITACPSSQADCLASAKTTFVTTETLVVSTTVCPLTEEPRPTTGSQPNYGSGSAAQSGHLTQEGSTKSTILSTRTATITACPSNVTDCPASAKSTFVTTETLVVSTTSGSGTSLSSHSVQEEMTTSTALSTRTATITACPSSVIDCPASEKSAYVTTETIVVSTTVCLVEDLAAATSTAVSDTSFAVSASTATVRENGVSAQNTLPHRYLALEFPPSPAARQPSLFVNVSSIPAVEVEVASETAPTETIAVNPQVVGTIKISTLTNEGGSSVNSEFSTVESDSSIAATAAGSGPGATNPAAHSSGSHASASSSKIIVGSTYTASSTVDAVNAVYTGGAANVNHWSVAHFVSVLLSIAAIIIMESYCIIAGLVTVPKRRKQNGIFVTWIRFADLQNSTRRTFRLKAFRRAFVATLAQDGRSSP